MKKNKFVINIKTVNYLIFLIAFFLQAFIDGVYSAHRQNPMGLKGLKYGVFCIGILFGILQIYNRTNTCFKKETKYIMLAILSFFLMSLYLIFTRGGDLGKSVEVLLRFSIAILYAYVVLNLFTFEEIYYLIVYVFLVSILGWFLEKGGDVFTLQALQSISFEKSNSAFESSFFSASAANCCAFFMYYRKNKILMVLSLLFVLLTFKRPAILFSVLFFLIPFVVDANYKINKALVLLWKIAIVISTVVYYYLLLPQNGWLMKKITGQETTLLTQGRNTLLQWVMNSGYESRGIGSSELVTGRGIEMDFVQFYIELSIVGLVILVFAYTFVAGRKVYSVLFMTFHMVTCLASAGLFNAFGWVVTFIIFGCINHLNEADPIKRKFPKMRIKVR